MPIQRVTLIDRSEFKLIYRVQHEGVSACLPVMMQRQQLGFTCARVFGSCKLLFDLDPYASGSLTPYLEDVGETADLLSHFGSYMNLVAFADQGLFNWGKGKQLQFWNALGEVAQNHPTILLSAVNEEDHAGGINRVEAIHDLPKIPGVLCSRGSNDGAADFPPLPVMDWAEIHTNAQSEWWRKDHNAWADIGEPNHIPSGVSEKPRPDQDGTVTHHEDAAATGALLCAFSTFHFAEGRDSSLIMPGSNTWDCAVAFVKGAKSVPVRYQPGQYNRPVDPAYLRVYQRILTGGDAHTVNVRY